MFCARPSPCWALYDPQVRDNSTEANQAKAQKLMSQTATIVTTFDRLRNGKPIVEGDPKLGLAANFLYTLTGKKPDEVMERAFDVALILHADHELNASTFAARVTAATLSDIYSAVTSAIGALKGPLHGGANEDVINMLLATEDVETALETKSQPARSCKVKIPGFGHRVYRTEDPRATHLRALSEELGKRTGHAELYQTSKTIEETVKEMKDLNANVDFYSASTYYSLGIPIDLFTPIFAVSRMAGWTAHILEQYRNNRLIRPRAEYVGRALDQPWVPVGTLSVLSRGDGAAHEPQCTIFRSSARTLKPSRSGWPSAAHARCRDVSHARQRAARGGHGIRAAEGAAECLQPGNRQAEARGRGYGGRSAARPRNGRAHGRPRRTRAANSTRSSAT